MATIHLCQAACCCHDDAHCFNEVRHALRMTDNIVQLVDLQGLALANRPHVDLAIFFLRPRSSFDAAFELLDALKGGVISLPVVWYRYSGELPPGMDYFLKSPIDKKIQQPILFYESARQIIDKVAELLGRTRTRSRVPVTDCVTIDGPLFEQTRTAP